MLVLAALEGQITARNAGRVRARILAEAANGPVTPDADGILAVGLRRPDGLALVSVLTGRVRRVVRLPGAPRHLQLAGPRGPGGPTYGGRTRQRPGPDDVVQGEVVD